jgi:hypothetical protein
MTFPKILKKFDKPLELHSNGVYLVNNLSQKIPKLPKDQKQNVNWNQTLLNEVDLKVK